MQLTRKYAKINCQCAECHDACPNRLAIVRNLGTCGDCLAGDHPTHKQVPADRRLAMMDERTWVSSDGRRTPVAKLADHHLVNAVRKYRKAMVLVLRATNPKDARSVEAVDMNLCATVRPWPAMLRELEKRGLRP